MARHEIILLARSVVENEGWTWLEPVDARLVRRFGFFGRGSWRVTTNYHKRGCNTRVVIDDKTGKVIRKGFLPR